MIKFITLLLLLGTSNLFAWQMQIEIKSNFKHDKNVWGTYQHIDDQLRTAFRNNNQMYQVVRSSDTGPGRLILKDNKIHLIKAQEENYMTTFQVYSLAYKASGNRKITSSTTDGDYNQMLKNYYQSEIESIIKKRSPANWKTIVSKSQYEFSEINCAIPKGAITCNVKVVLKN